MADPNERTVSTSEAETNRGRPQGLGVGQREMDAQRDPGGFQAATNPEQRSFEGDLDGATNGDRPREADFGGSDVQAEGPHRAPPALAMPDRNAAGLGDVEGDLGAGTPANVDIHKLGQDDKPEQEWGEPAGEGAVYSTSHAMRPERTEALRGQGAKTRRATKDQISRRG
ncbi:hypothetical protein [Phenylobacterium sp.]|uniref:hypothetical protein n=1 Tax=Phenylobacterium sp. TaxID=1871053 RepID=UPI0025E28EA4|nr:hypothetical protein [Phenylobacterium sp.]